MPPTDKNLPVPPAGPPAAAALAVADGTEEARHLAGWRRLALWPLAGLVRLWTASLRIEISERARRNLAWSDGPVVLAIWHNRLFLATEVFRRFRQSRPVHALVSPSRDGAWSEAFHQLAGLRAVRGSSSHDGLAAARALVAVLRAGHDVGLTPDGPRGPRYEFKPGALVVARRAGAAVLLVGGAFESAWRLRSWDGLYLPRPFSRVRIDCDHVSATELAGLGAAELAARLGAISPDEAAGVEAGAVV